MLSGTVRAVLMSWVTISIVASICALRSTISWLRYAVRTGSRPESGSSKSRISGSRTSARASPARLRIPPEISPGSLCSAPRGRSARASPSTILLDLRLALLGVLAQWEGDVVDRSSSSRTARRPGTARRTSCGSRRGAARGCSGRLCLRCRRDRGRDRSRPMRCLRKTDLPVPDGPSSTEISPLGRVSVTSSQMTCRPNDFVRAFDFDLNAHAGPAFRARGPGRAGPVGRQCSNATSTYVTICCEPRHVAWGTAR